jgi:Flp pilus assembly protein TadD
MAAFRKSIAINPTAAGYSNLGTLQFSLGRYEEARKSYEQATQLAPADYVMWANLGDSCRWAPGMREKANDAYARAIAAADAALQVNPKDAYARSVIALCMAKSGRAQDGSVEIRRALELDPTNASVLYNAAVIAVIRGNLDSALSWVESAVASGYSPAELETDPELTALRTLPAFKRAVQSPQS